MFCWCTFRIRPGNSASAHRRRTRTRIDGYRGVAGDGPMPHLDEICSLTTRVTASPVTVSQNERFLRQMTPLSCLSHCRNKGAYPKLISHIYVSHSTSWCVSATKDPLVGAMQKPPARHVHSLALCSVRRSVCAPADDGASTGVCPRRRSLCAASSVW